MSLYTDSGLLHHVSINRIRDIATSSLLNACWLLKTRTKGSVIPWRRAGHGTTENPDNEGKAEVGQTGVSAVFVGIILNACRECLLMQVCVKLAVPWDK